MAHRATTYITLTLVAILALFIAASQEDVQLADNINTREQLAAISGSGSGLVSHYTFDDGTANDSLGSNSGTIYGATPVAGKLSGALQFDGVDDYIYIPDKDSIDFGSSDFSISFWHKKEAGNSIITKLDASLAGPGYSINWLSNTAIRIVLDDGPNIESRVANPQFVISDSASWHHYVFTVNRTLSKGIVLYVDGIAQNCSGNCSYDLLSLGNISNTRNLGIGTRDVSNRGLYLKGAVDDIRIYNRALNATEVNELYAYNSVTIPEPDQTGGVIVDEPPTQDTTPPTISNITVSNITETSAIISWQTDEPATSQVEYGPSNIYGNKTVEDNTLTITHSQVIQGLDHGSVYYLRVISKNGNGLNSVSASQTFTTVTDISGSIVEKNINILENSSFEISDSHGWGFPNAIQNAPLFTIFDTNTAYHGKTSVRLPMSTIDNAQTLVSKIYHLKPNTKYTLSFYARSDYSSSEIVVSFVNTHSTEFGPGDSGSPTGLFAPSQWKRFSYSYTTTSDASKSTYNIIIQPKAQGVPGKSIWIDAIQLEEGAVATDYIPNNGVEVGVADNLLRPGNSFFEDEPVIMNLLAFNNHNNQISTAVNYEVYDYFNRVVKSGTFNIAANPNTVTSHSLDLTLSSNKRGSFRLITWIDRKEGTRDETVFSVIPRPHVWGVNENSIFGAHVPFRDYWLSAMQRVGIKWNRTLSTGRQFNWDENQPTCDNFVWHDAEIDKARSYGMLVLGVIGTELYNVPECAKRDPSGLPNIEKWRSFVYEMALHYKGKVKYWEIWNEPDTEGGEHDITRARGALSAEDYAVILKTASESIRSADPNAVIVAMASYYHDFYDTVFKAIGPDYVDVISTHRYPSINMTHLLQFWNVIKTYGNKAVWNSETGLKIDPFQRTLLSEYLNRASDRLPNLREYRARTETQVENFAVSIGSGMSKYFYYDARHTEAPNFLVTYSLFEYDGTISPMAVTLAVLANLFEGSTGQGSINLHSEVSSYAFMRGTTPLIIIWPNSPDRVYKLQSSLSSSQINVYDVMGNLIPITSGVNITRSPIYVEGKGISITQLQAGLTISSATDTEPPILSLTTFPTGATDGKGVILRWFGSDNVSYSFPGQVIPQGIQYAYRLYKVGTSGSWTQWSSQSSIIVDLQDGIYVFEVKARDARGNESSPTIQQFAVGSAIPPSQLPRPAAYIPSGGIPTTPVLDTTVPLPTTPTLTPDQTPPSVSITSPTSGSSINPSSVVVSANATDPAVSGAVTSGLRGVQFKLNSQNLGLEDTTSPYSVTWDATALPDGTYTITALAIDVAGNTRTSNPVSITLSTPVVTPTVNQSQTTISTSTTSTTTTNQTSQGTTQTSNQTQTSVTTSITPAVTTTGGGGGGGGGGISARRVTVSTTNTPAQTTFINPALIKAIVSTQTTGQTPGFSFQRYLGVGTNHPDVKVLQQTLNSLGYTIAQGGVGSPGQETTYYGPLTTLAIQKFQCAVLKICQGSPTTNGYGNFGPATRAALNARLGNTATTPMTTTPTPVSSTLTKWLTLGMTDPQVLTLQRLLNAKGYTVSVSGPGSIGQETSYFGPATLRALEKFQCATLNVCSGSTDTNGYGGVGPRTRGELGK